MMGRILGAGGGVSAIGQAAEGLAEVFTPNATRRMELSAEAQMAALEQLGLEYGSVGQGWFDQGINGLNRLPRPLLAFGTLGLFGYAMADPDGFGARMVGLNMVPEPLWWLLGAIVAFYFGAREAHYFRVRPTGSAPQPPDNPTATADNAALADWRAGQ